MNEEKMNIPNKISNNADSVFKNKLIVERILKKLNIENDIFQHLNLRLVTKAFDSQFLLLIKRNFRKLQIDLTFDWDKNETKVTINQQLISKKEVLKCSRFLRNIVQIEIESVHFTGDTDFINVSEMHKLIIESLLLTNEKPIRHVTSDVEVCSASGNRKECIPCRQLAPLCDEFGPMAFDTLLNSFSNPHHFSTLHITDYLLQMIAIHCTKTSETKEECFSQMKSIINSNITCDNLNVQLFVMDWNMGNLPNAQAREVINEILQKWKIKNIKIKFIMNRYRNVSRSWRRPEKRFFTQFHFGMFPSYVDISEVSKLFIEHVVIDAKWSESEYRSADRWKEPYLHLFSNLIRFFPTSKDIFVVRELKKDVTLTLDEILKNLVEHAWDECPDGNRTELFIRLKYSDFVTHPEREIDIPEINGNYISDFELSFASPEISQKFENWNNVLGDFDMEDIRKAFTLRNHLSNRELHFELIHSESTLQMAKQNISTPFQTLFYYQFFISL
uniref:FTH domain-containing protein n=1 Tax=Caenorhabditis tropicalis TaxID=1561998 RepID=A0A1I7T3B1_9PELO